MEGHNGLRGVEGCHFSGIGGGSSHTRSPVEAQQKDPGPSVGGFCPMGGATVDAPLKRGTSSWRFEEEDY